MLLRDGSKEVEEQRRAELLLWDRADVSPQCALTNGRRSYRLQRFLETAAL
jgi:hypothetical protein